jgi:hypothetical protein
MHASSQSVKINDYIVQESARTHIENFLVTSPEEVLVNAW